MKRLVVIVLLLLTSVMFNTPGARADQSPSYELDSRCWTVQYTISSVTVPPGGASPTLHIGFTAKIPIYDFSLTVVTNPASLVSGKNVWTFSTPNDEILPGILQQNNFQISIPNTAQPGNQYYINLLLQGYNDSATFPHISWTFVGIYSYRGFFIWTETPECAQDTTGTQNSIAIAVSA